MNSEGFNHVSISGEDMGQTEEDLMQARQNPTLSNPEWTYDFLDSPEQKEVSSSGSLVDHLKLVSNKEDSDKVIGNTQKLNNSEIQFMFLNMLPITREARLRITEDLLK